MLHANGGYGCCMPLARIPKTCLADQEPALHATACPAFKKPALH
jgi:hypothetical protein